MSNAEEIRIRRDTVASRFEILLNDVVAGYADYQDGTDSARTFPHTVVAEYGGRGLAGQLIGEALRVTKEEGFTVRPTCSFVARYIEKNPDSAVLT